MQTLEDFGTAFKDKVIEKILDSLFEKIPWFKKMIMKKIPQIMRLGIRRVTRKLINATPGRDAVAAAAGAEVIALEAKPTKDIKKEKVRQVQGLQDEH